MNFLVGRGVLAPTQAQILVFKLGCYQTNLSSLAGWVFRVVCTSQPTVFSSLNTVYLFVCALEQAQERLEQLGRCTKNRGIYP